METQATYQVNKETPIQAETIFEKKLGSVNVIQMFENKRSTTWMDKLLPHSNDEQLDEEN